jgi:hypothetical protein
MRADRAMSLMRLRPNGGSAAAKSRLKPAWWCDLDKVQGLAPHTRALEPLAAALAANSRLVFGPFDVRGPHWIFARRRDGSERFRAIGACHEIAENIPQRSRSPVTFGSACAQIEQCA